MRMPRIQVPSPLQLSSDQLEASNANLKHGVQCDEGCVLECVEVFPEAAKACARMDVYLAVVLVPSELAYFFLREGGKLGARYRVCSGIVS